MILTLLSIILAGVDEKDFHVRLDKQTRNVPSTSVTLSPLQFIVFMYLLVGLGKNKKLLACLKSTPKKQQ